MDPYIHALMNDGLDSLLEEIPDWTTSQGEELKDSEDDSDLLIAARRADCRVILRENCIKKPGFLRECAGCQKYSECKTILALKGTRLKSMKESVVRYGIVTRRLILRLKNCVC